MASNDLALRFSDETYATKLEVSKALGTSLVDTIWSNIIAYRSHFTRVLSLRNIEKTPFNVVLTPTIMDRCTSLERKLSKVLLRYSRLAPNAPGKAKLRVENYTKILYWVAKKYNLAVSENFLHTLILSSISALSPDQMILQRYQDALKASEIHYRDPLDENFYANAYSIITGNSELVGLYREEEIGDIGQKAIIGRMYNAAPVERIQEMMENFFEFAQKSELGSFVKAVICYYFINYVKPFDSHSEEMALLTMKNILAHGDFDDLAALLDLESLLSYNQEQLNRVFVEVQKTNDMTYLLVYVLDLTESIATDLLDRIVNAEMVTVKTEFYEAEKPVAKPVEQPLPVETPKPVVVQPVEQPRMVEAVKPVEAPKSVVEQPKAVEPPKPVAVEKPKLEIKPEPSIVESKPTSGAPIPEYEPSSPTTNPINYEMRVAIPTMPVGLDEKDAARIEENLLEINPRLKKGEAYFYARHCTIGKYYTIAQYKKNLDCAYETARTSMDHLVYEGYYRKEMLKNKFIYTPIPRR